MTVRISLDDGTSWPISKTLYPGPAAYSCLAVLPDRGIACLYERGGTNAYEKITFAKFPLSWLEGKSNPASLRRASARRLELGAGTAERIRQFSHSSPASPSAAFDMEVDEPAASDIKSGL